MINYNFSSNIFYKYVVRPFVGRILLIILIIISIFPSNAKIELQSSWNIYYTTILRHPNISLYTHMHTHTLSLLVLERY